MFAGWGTLAGAGTSVTVWAYVGPSALEWAMLALGTALAYCLGSVNFGVVVSRLFFHEDVRAKGSGNAGTTNILRTYGKKAAALTLLGDMGKGVLAVVLSRALVDLAAADPMLGVYGGYLAAIGAVCGHLWPVWFGFKGGKGVAVAAGAILATEPVVLLALAVVFFAVAFASRIVSLASVTVAVLYPVFTGLYSWYAGRDIAFTVACAAAMAVLVIFMHRANLQRLANGTEYKFGQKKQ